MGEIAGRRLPQTRGASSAEGGDEPSVQSAPMGEAVPITPPPRNIVVFAPTDVHALEVASVMDVCNEANAIAGSAPLYTITTVAERRGAIRCASGLVIVPDVSIDDSAPAVDTLIVAGSYEIPSAPSAAVIAWLRQRSASAQRYGAVCTGTFLMERPASSTAGRSPRTGTMRTN
jgi:transcriptional regulator GlxA family with amidase domain